ncbi:hypothetical protein ACO0SA_004843 [Hanseniaspora valbyensis]
MESKTEDIIPVIKTRKPERDLNKKKKNSKGSNEYKLISKIGHGAYGTVYKAQQLSTQKIVAIKIVEVEEDEFIEDYMTEIDLLQNLSHNNIVKCLGFEKKQNNNNNNSNIISRFNQQPYCKLFIFLEFCSKGSLRDIMSDKTICPNGYISENLCRNYINQTLHGLKYLHDQGIIHRDIKCGNLLLTGENDTIKLADFGISTKITHTLKSNNKNNNAGVAMTCIGSPNWMAPEILLGQGATTKSDIWSLGSTLVEMLTGQPPFYNLNNREAVCYAIVHDFFIFNKKDRERLSSNCLIFVAYLFNKNIFQRPSAKDLLEGKFIDSMKNSNWLSEEENDLKIKSEKLLKFKEAQEDNKLAMFDEDFVIEESLLSGEIDTVNKENGIDQTGISLNLQNSPFKPKKYSSTNDIDGNGNDINSSSNNIQEGIDSMGRSDMILEQFGKINLNSLKILRLIQDINFSELIKFIVNNLLKVEENNCLNFNLLTYFKVVWGNIDNLGIELASKIKILNVKFLETNGSFSLLLYLNGLINSKQDPDHILIKNWIYILNQSKWKDTIFALPQTLNFTQCLINSFASKKFDIILWEFVLKLSHNIISKFGDFYVEQFNLLLEYLLKIDKFRNSQDLEMFQILFLKLTELNVKLTTFQVDSLSNLSGNKNDMKWRYFVVKVLNNMLKSINENQTHGNFEKNIDLNYIGGKDIFHISDYVKDWLFKDIIGDISKFKFISLIEFKYCRYFLELVYNLFTYLPSTKLALLENLKLIMVCQRLTKIKLNPQTVDNAIIRYHRYDLKLIIRLISDLSLEFNNSALDIDISVYKEYAYTSIVYLQQHITYSVYAIDILSNCTHKLLKNGLINFVDFKAMQLIVNDDVKISIDLRLLLNGFIEMSLLQKNITENGKQQDEIKQTDFDLVFKSVHKLLSSLTIAAKENGEENDELKDYSTIITDDSFNSDSDIKVSLNYQYSPLALFIVDNNNFTNIVKKILEKYKGTLILQIDFLKFLKLLFKQYVGFRVEYYLNLQNSDSDSNTKNKKLMSYSILKSNTGTDDLMPKRTPNFKTVRDYLLTLWEDSSNKLLHESEAASVASSPKKFLNMDSLDSSISFVSNNHNNNKEQERVGHNSILIKTLVRDIDLIYKESITLA